jgi:hypothetical protein
MASRWAFSLPPTSSCCLVGKVRLGGVDLHARHAVTDEEEDVLGSATPRGRREIGWLAAATSVSSGADGFFTTRDDRADERGQRERSQNTPHDGSAPCCHVFLRVHRQQGWLGPVANLPSLRVVDVESP